MRIREWRCQDIDQVLLHGDHFSLSSELLDKNASIRSKLPTAACWCREITEEKLKQTCFMSKAKATSVPQLGNHSQYSSHVGTLNLIDESKSLPVEANNSTIKLHLPVEAKEKIAMIDESKPLPVEANNSTIELLDKNASIRSKLPTAACWSREITEENLKQTCFMSKAKATSVPQLGNHSQYSSHVGALNLIDESKSLPVEANNSTIKLHLPVEVKEKIVMIDESKSLPVEANNSTIELHLPVEAKEKIAMIDESKPLPVEANNSTIELHLAVKAKEKLSEYIESKSLPVEVKENLAIVNSKYGSLVEANHSFPNSCFETNAESISLVESIHSTLQSNSFSTFESKENFSSTTLNFRLLNNVEHSSKCFGPTERRFAGYEEQLDCDIYSINYEKRLQGLINANDTLNPCLSLCSALMNTFTTYKQAIVIFRNITLTILTESNGSFYTSDPHARNHDGMPNSNGTATALIYVYYPRANCLKTIPFTAAHTYIAHIWQYPPPPPPPGGLLAL